MGPLPFTVAATLPVLGVSASSGVGVYNHYDLVFPGPFGAIAANDWAMLSIARDFVSTPTTPPGYDGNIFITSIEFRYKSL